ncbi:hypothetical protein KHM83_09710 [Fusibacter paucivorans]|uniref:Uncharacterized protein n=1 Tax=Fusibacter paucivorans TaxID=76009 RepID=A0ABS5PRA5_9FIRM|nr:hypothetical protein [Fusibacter paucivorans]MBS7526954.1 hypothetical protein [Fusibacter paucivorans]
MNSIEMKQPDHRSSRRGSIAIESLIVMTVTMLITFTAIGFVYSIFVETRIVGEMQTISKEMSVIMSATLTSNELPVREVNRLALAGWGTARIRSKCNDLELVTAYSSATSTLDNEGVFIWTLTYDISLPLNVMRKKFSVPVSAALVGDAIKPESTVVYITRTGECYHRETCYHLRQSKIKTTLEKARADGYRACSHCRPHRSTR